MTVPVLLVAGFLGAGKTTLVNHLLQNPDDRRIAAVVNDFGAIDVDATLLGLSVDGVVSLKNGCICCSLQGDLMRTLVTLTRRCPSPDAIVIETSGTSDPSEIVRSLLDPVIFAATPLDTVVVVVDARHLSDRPALLDDPLWRSQVRAADFVILGKTDLVDAAECAWVRSSLAHLTPRSRIFEAVQGTVAPALLFSQGEHVPVAGSTRGAFTSTDRFESLNWTARVPLSLTRFQAAIGRLSSRLLRAKGFVTFEHRPDQPVLFQLVGARVTIIPTSVVFQDGCSSGLVLIAEAGLLEPDAVIALLNSTMEPSHETARVAHVSTGPA